MEIAVSMPLFCPCGRLGTELRRPIKANLSENKTILHLIALENFNTIQGPRVFNVNRYILAKVICHNLELSFT